MVKFLSLFYLFLLSLFLLISSGVVDSQDGFQYLAVARNIYYEGKPTAPIYEYDKEKNIHMSTYVGKDGETYSPTGLGYSLALLPAVAISDSVYKVYNVSPPVHFPLESDWLILMLASFTNGFFGAALGVILFLYFIELKLTKKQALIMGFVSIFATNLLVYTKHVMAHMMFVTLLVLTFYLLRRYVMTANRKVIIFSGVTYGLTVITYNPTFLLALIPLGLYYLLLTKIELKGKFFKRILKDGVLFLLGMLPFIVVYFWFENLRAAAENLSSPSFYTSYVGYLVSALPFSVFFEGLYGQLFSVGRSIFLYSPLLLIIIFFWHKLKKQITPELVVFLSLAFIYLIFYAAQNSYGGIERGYAGLWHGESSWGPRYLTPLIPFGMLIVGFIFQSLSKLQKLIVFYPLLIIGIYVQLLGVLMPYQIKFHDLQRESFVNHVEYTSYAYSNLIPRFSPLFTMSKKLVKLALSYPVILRHGPYSVKFYDGFDFPFNVGLERWRTINGEGYISFRNLAYDPIDKISFGLINHPISTSSAKASFGFILNGKELLDEPVLFTAGERKAVGIPIDKNLLNESENQLKVRVTFDDPTIIIGKSQIPGLISFQINDREVNKESLDFPYISELGPKITGKEYQNYGGLNEHRSSSNKDPWLSWHIHTQIYERVPDFWWTKAWHYWDLPQKFFLLLFILNLFLLGYSGFKVFSLRNNLK